MAFLESLTAHQARNLLNMAERLDQHFDKASFLAHQPIGYARLGTRIKDAAIRQEEMAFHFAEMVALHSAVFDLPDIAFQGDDAIVGLAKQHGADVNLTAEMVRASYTFMQWLGSNVGRAFIHELDDDIKAHEARSKDEQDTQLADIHDKLQCYFQTPSRCRQQPFNATALALDEMDADTRLMVARQHRHAILSLGIYLKCHIGGMTPTARNVFDYMSRGAFYADDEAQVVAMSLVAWLGTPEGAAHLRFLDAHRVDRWAS